MKRKHNNAIRRAVLFGCLIGAVLLTACGKEQKKDVSSITIDDLIAANTREALLGKYDVVRVKRTIDGEEEADRYYTKDDYFLSIEISKYGKLWYDKPNPDVLMPFFDKHCLFLVGWLMMKGILKYK